MGLARPCPACSIRHEKQQTSRSTEDPLSDEQIKRMHDILDIQKLKAIYCAEVDDSMLDPAHARTRLPDIFVEDAIADYEYGLLEGRAAIVDYLVIYVGETADLLWHSIHTPLIEVDGDSATGRWTVFVRVRNKGADTIDTFIGRYFDEFRRTADGWRISSVRWVTTG